MKNKQTEFNNLMRPVMEYLAENYHPHVTLMVTASTAELLEGLMCTVSDDNKPQTADVIQIRGCNDQ